MLIDAKLLYFPSFVNINFSFVSACSSLCYSGLTGRKANKNGRAGAAGDIPLQAAPTETVV